jgi:hypothetical protein
LIKKPLRDVFAVFQQNVMRTALNNAGGRNESYFGVLLQFGEGQETAVAHGGAYFFQGELDVIF